MIRTARVLLDLSSCSLLGVLTFQAPLPPDVSWILQNLNTIGGGLTTLVCLVWVASRLVTQAQTNNRSAKEKLSTDSERIKTLERLVFEKDHQIEKALTASASVAARLRLLEGSVRKIDRKFYYLSGALEPIVKEFEGLNSGGTRTSALAAAMDAIDTEDQTGEEDLFTSPSASGKMLPTGRDGF